jgi:hypothetical protein
MDAFVASGLGLGCVLVAIHVALEIRRRRFPELVALIQLVLASGGISAGVRVASVTITKDTLGPFKSEDRIYLVLGALALAVASIQSIVSIFRDASLIPGLMHGSRSEQTPSQPVGTHEDQG